jgi:peroxiredoxin
MLGFSNYNYEHFSREILEDLEQAHFSGPAAGERAPDFQAETLEGETLRLSDYRRRKNVLLVFGSATCPMTAAVIREINALNDRLRGDDVEFLFIYVRETNPGEHIPAHQSGAEKAAAARLLRDAEEIEMPVLVDDVRGSIHRKYSKLPSPAFLIDKSGRVAFRSMWANPQELAAALDELLELQEERRVNHVVVRGGQDLSVPLTYTELYSHRALERGGKEAIHDFRDALGDFWFAHEPATGLHLPGPLLQHPGRVLAATALTTAVLAGGLYAGFELRKRRLGVRRNPYRAYEKEEVRDTETGTDYGAVGI